MFSKFKKLSKLDNRKKKLIQQVFDACVLFVSFSVAMAMRLGRVDAAFSLDTWILVAPTIPLTLIFLLLLGVYRPIVRYVSTSTFVKIGIGVLCSIPLIYLHSYLLDLWMPRTVPLIYLFVGVCSVIAGRLVIRSWFRMLHTPKLSRVIVYGAGPAGQQLLSSLRQSSEFRPVAIIDDNPAMIGKEINDVLVYAPSDIDKLMGAYNIRHVLLALDAPSTAKKRQIVDRFVPFDIDVRTIPAMADVISGRAQISDVRQIKIEDLLGRDIAQPNDALLRHNIQNKAVMVTGAGGSIGSELCRQILDANPHVLVLVDVSEFALYSIDMELLQRGEAAGSSTRIIPVLASVTDEVSIRRIIQEHKIETVLHAAAYKHVPMVEHNVISGIQNNVFGTLAVLKAAIDQNVRSFTLVSTDKAVRPTNVMGASKRVAELICQAYAQRQSGTIISMVRFGNVLGSSGSVVPHFRKQIAAGGPVTVTDPQITRYFMTIPEASQLVLQASGMAKGGDTFLLDMGMSVNITQMAARMIKLSGSVPFVRDTQAAEASGLRQEGDIEISFSGLRPGEKLYEELLIDDTALETDHPLIMRANEVQMSWDDIQTFLANLSASCEANDPEAIKSLLDRPEVGYHPQVNPSSFPTASAGNVGKETVVLRATANTIESHRKAYS